MIWLAILLLLAVIALCGLLLGVFAQKYKVEGDPLAEKIDAILPQTQCGQCGFPGCKPYAEAIAKGEADINRCPPGGQEGVDKLAEDWCIGCTKCIKACPVDAILGSNQKMHTIISDECTGCRLCVDPCPVNCIIMKPRDEPWNWDKPQNPQQPQTPPPAPQPPQPTES